MPLAVPVALKITEVAADEEDSLAALPGLVREGARVLRGLTNPLMVDSIVPRAAFRLARGIVLMTHVRGELTCPLQGNSGKIGGIRNRQIFADDLNSTEIR